MKTEKEEDFYHSLPKKELQNLSKKYGLSPYMTKSNLANSLASYFKTSGVKISEDFKCSMFNVRRSLRLSSKQRETSGLQNVFQCAENDFRNIEESPKINSERKILTFAREVEVAYTTQTQLRNVTSVTEPADNAFASSVKSSTPIPSFEFSVRSIEGINLIVDLNSSPLDWSKRLENEVCVCQNLQKYKFQSFRQELEYLRNNNKQMKSSLLWNADNKINSSHVQAHSTLNSIERENGHVEFDQSDGDDGSMEYSGTKPCSYSRHLEEEKELPLLSKLNSDVPNWMVSDTKSCPTDTETKTVDSDAIVVHEEILPCNYVVNFTSDGPVSINVLEDQISNLCNENCGNKDLQNTCSLENPGCSAICSMEMQLSAVASQHKCASCSPSKNNCFLNLVDIVQNAETGADGLANSSEVNREACGNDIPTSAKEWEMISPVNGKDASECLYFSSTLEKRSKKSLSNGGTKRKRHHGVFEDGYGQHDKRVLRSTKRLFGQVLPRRSMRLVSKNERCT